MRECSWSSGRPCDCAGVNQQGEVGGDGTVRPCRTDFYQSLGLFQECKVGLIFMIYNIIIHNIKRAKKWKLLNHLNRYSPGINPTRL